MRWEYETVFSNIFKPSKAVNGMGAEGWELVAAHESRGVVDDETVILYFKRVLYGPARVGLECPECGLGTITAEQTCTNCPIYEESCAS